MHWAGICETTVRPETNNPLKFSNFVFHFDSEFTCLLERYRDDGPPSEKWGHLIRRLYRDEPGVGRLLPPAL